MDDCCNTQFCVVHFPKFHQFCKSAHMCYIFLTPSASIVKLEYLIFEDIFPIGVTCNLSEVNMAKIQQDGALSSSGCSCPEPVWDFWHSDSDITTGKFTDIVMKCRCHFRFFFNEASYLITFPSYFIVQTEKKHAPCWGVPPGRVALPGKKTREFTGFNRSSWISWVQKWDMDA